MTTRLIRSIALLCLAFSSVAFAQKEPANESGASEIQFKRPQAPPNYRATTQGKLDAARQVIQDKIDIDSKPRRNFGMRTPSWAIAHDQAGSDCYSIKVIARAIEVEQPYFANPQASLAGQRIAIVPIRAEILMVEANEDEGGKNSPMDYTDGGDCAFEYERWSFANKRYEKVPGFRTRNFFDEFTNWGESIVEPGQRPGRWVAVDLDKRYVRFTTRVRVSSPIPYQRAPQFPQHFPAEHSLKLLRAWHQETVDQLQKNISDRDENAKGKELEKDIARMRWQNERRNWVINRLTNSLDRLKNIKPFEEIKP
jgi:hypothetical protein